MKVFYIIQRVFTLLSILPSSTEIKWLTIVLYKLIICAIILIFLISDISSILYFKNHLKNDLENAIYALFQIAAISCSLHNLIGAIFLRQKIKEIIKRYQNILDSSKISCIDPYIFDWFLYFQRNHKGFSLRHSNGVN